MTTTRDIMEAVEIAGAAIESIKRVYSNRVPKDFIRPCLLIQPVTTIGRDGSKAVLDITEHFLLTVYDTTDDYDSSDTGRLLDLQLQVASIFRGGYFVVGDRALDVSASTSGRDYDQAYVDLQFTFFDLRGETQENAQPIEHIDTELVLKG